MFKLDVIFKLAVISLFTLALYPTILASDDEQNSTLESLMELSLDELLNVTVTTASKHEQSPSDSPSVTIVITSEEIERFGQNNLFEILERATSVYMTGSVFFPQNVISIRGTLLGHYDHHVLMLINGRPVREGYAGGINFAIFNAFPIETIDRIEILRGPGSVLYGTNAYSGVINIITKKDTDNTTKISFVGGSLGTEGLSLQGSSENDGLQLNWGLQFFNEDGWKFEATDNNGITDHKHFGEENVGGFISAEYKGFKLNALFTDSKQGFMGASTNWSGQPEIDDRYMQSNRLFVDAGYTYNFSDDWYLDTNLSYGEMEFDHYNYTGYSNDTFLESTSHWQVNENLRWIAGVTYWHQDVGSTDGLRDAPIPSFTSSWYSLYSQINYTASDQLKLVVGALMNKADNIESDIVPRAGAIYQFSPNTGIKLMYAEAFRTAFGVETGFNLILRNPDNSIRGGLRGNPSLKPESIKTTDLQLYFNDSDYQLALTYFYSHLENLVGRERAADNVLDFINEGHIDIHGIELELKWNIFNNLHLISSYTNQSNKNSEGVKDFMTTPNKMFKAGLIYYLKSGDSIAIYNNSNGAANDIVAQNPDRMAVNPDADSFNLVSVNLSLKLEHYLKSDFWKDTTLEFYGYNLLDESIYQPEYVGKRVNTLPARSGRAFYLALDKSF